MASRPPAASRLLRAQRAQRTLPTPPASRGRRRLGLGGPGASERAGRGALARRGSSTWSAPQTESLTLLPGPAAAPSPGSSQRVRPPGSAPGLLSLRQSRTPSAAPLPHPCSRDQTRPRPLSAGPGHLVTRPWRLGSGGGGGGRVFSRLAPQDSGGGAACSLAGKAVGFPRYAVGFHTYQRMIGCELLEDGNTTGFLQYAYDRQDFIIFSKDTLSWMAMDNVAHITKQAWEASQHELQYQKNWLEEECIAWLKRFLEYGKGTLQRTEISTIWIKNGEEIVQEMDYGDLPPGGDGTYQTWVSVELDPQSSDLYSCHVEHGGVHVVLQGSQESETMLLAMKAVGFIVPTTVLSGVGVVAWQRKP
ncbi:LOW QUALITY PROTEIN: major histocompatibility complex class I-related gene protein [Monodon monoceros]|uniref:LOW QUALITY PROTEIN: major histocompatibility complex class I-related gene protein n=1 Tax=Monodon monoceros TaxID=40151 RepID=UPI0010F45634|nr:LOW QUALITY PROTEIN: major histocompatibility complex class I-related gene protein [Monodon monoceros]